jgi:TonB-dependent starch-binding outer membrane protein SusC
MKKNLLFILSLMLFSTTLWAQQTITGKVTGESGESLPGVSVRIKDTQTGSVTDANGNYSIKSVAKGVLVFSSIGYKNQEITISSRNVINVSMVSDIGALEEVVVIGYGTVRKKDLVGSVGAVKSKDFGTVVATDAKQLIQGKIAGVQVINNGGLPGSGAKIFIRGTGSFTNSDPLYLIDGLPGDINSVAPQDIEEMSVMKDASAVAIYGSKAANGVVMVTTKQGKGGAMKVTYNGWVGVSQPWKRLDLLNAAQYIDLVKDMAPNTPAPAINDPANLITRTDWQDQIFRTGKSTEHYINMSGGGEKLLYSISLGYSNQQAIMQNYDYQRYNFRVNLIENISKRVRIGQALNMRYTVTDGVTGSFVDAIRMPPYAPVRDASVLGGFTNIRPTIDLQDAVNPQAIINLTDNVNRGLGTTLQIFGEVELIDGLRWRAQASAEAGLYSGYSYQQAFANANKTYDRTLNEYINTGIYNPIIENFLTYNKDFGKHNFSALAGMTYANGQRVTNIRYSGTNFPSDELPNINGAVDKPAIGTSPAAPGKAVTGGTRENDYNRRWSYFGRLQYGYNEKYLVTASIREDYSPAFGKNNSSGVFPAVGLAWRASQEDFMKELPVVSELKFRASWGLTGNDNIGYFRNLPDAPVFQGYGGAPTYSFGENKEFATGSVIASIGNPNLKWEETSTVNVGFDLGLLQNKLNLTFDYYSRNNNDLLMQGLVDVSTGLGDVYNPANLPQNIGRATNKGFETALTYRKSTGDFRYSISGNVSYNKNEVIFMPPNNKEIQGGGFEDVSATQRTQVGYPIGVFWGYKVDKVASTTAEVAALNARALEASQGKIKEYQAGLLAGDIIFKDLNNDGVVDAKDQTSLGSPIPTWMFGVTMNASYKNFDMNINASGLGDVYLANALTYNLEGTNKVFNGSTALLNRWRKEGDVTTVPKAGQNAKGTQNLRPSDRYIEDASYLRLRDVTLGYTIPTNSLKSLFKDNVSSLRVYLTAQNLLTFTGYKGYDPEVSGNIFDRGVDRGQYPQARTFMLGVQVGF